MPDSFFQPTADGYAVPLQYFPADNNNQKPILLLPALGVKARFYGTFASKLSAQGYPTLVMEQRGHGQSGLRASRQHDWGYAEYLRDDIPTAIDWLQQQTGQEQIILVGHSLGGQMASLYASLNPEIITASIIVACGTPWVKVYDFKTQCQLRLLNTLIPGLHTLLGYYPGEHIGFGGREARRLINDWRHLLRHNNFHASGLGIDLNTAAASHTGALLAIGFELDDYAPPAVISALLSKFPQAQTTQQAITDHELSVPADHFKWAKAPEPVVAHIHTWLTSLSTIDS